MIEYLRRRKHRKDRAEYRNGFGWAMAAYYIERCDPDDIENVASLDTAMFYVGAVKALALIQPTNRET